MKVSVKDNQFLSVRITDEEAELLIARLQARLERRKEVLALEPSLASWSDHVHTFGGEIRDVPGGMVQFYICAV